ncbi:MAG: CHAT domain-containing protein [Bacteroidia bacterium]
MGISIDELKKIVQDKVSKGYYFKAFEPLQSFVDEQAIWAKSDLAMLTGRYKKFKSDKRKYILDSRDEMKEEAQIVQSILDFPDFLAEGPQDYDDSGKKADTGKKLILFLSANPADTGPLQLAKEHREIKRGLESTLARDQFELETETAVRASDMRDSIRRRKPQIVHFSGHGISEKELKDDAIAGSRGLSWAKAARPEVTQFGVSGLGIALLDRQGNTQLVKNDILARMFELAKEDVECVVFNNCYSQGQAEAVKEHIPYVIGMNRAVPDETAIAFAVEFYKALGDGEPIPEAFNHAKLALEMDEFPGWDIPMLLQ